MGVKFSTRRLYEKLREQCNPKNFINQESFDAEKVKLANKYYQKINECCDDIDALENLEKEINPLFPTQNILNEKSDSEVDDITTLILFMVILGILGVGILVATQNT